MPDPSDSLCASPSASSLARGRALLRAVVGADEILVAWLADHPLTPVDLAWLAAHGMTNYAAERIYRAGAASRCAPDARLGLRQLTARALLAAELRSRELGRILDALADVRIVPALFKGAILAHTIYPLASSRPMGDLDLWLTADEMARGQMALQALGYQQRVKEHRSVALQAQRSGEIQMVGRPPASGLVELHYGVFAGEWLHRAAQVDERGVRSRLTPVTVVGRPALALAPEDSLIQLAVHLAINHQMAHPGVRGLLDIVLQARARLPDWALLAARARQWRVATAVWLAFDLARQLLDFEEARPACAELAPSAGRRFLLRRFISADALLARRNLTRWGPVRFMYQLLLVDRPQDAARLVGWTLWPDDAWLAARYGQAGARQRGRHLWSAIRARV